MKQPSCFQSSNPTCMDLILTNKKEFFKNTGVIEVGISDHHSLIVTALKRGFIKTTDHRSPIHRPTNPPTTYPLTHQPTIFFLILI